MLYRLKIEIEDIGKQTVGKEGDLSLLGVNEEKMLKIS